jgi:multidrug transporter EmrE-like cation transporter
MYTPVSSMLWVTSGSVVGSLGAVGLKAGARHVEANLLSLLRNWRLATGLGLYLVSTVFFIRGLKTGDLSILYPMVSVGYVCTLIWAKLFFGEKITPMKIAAVLLILAGVAQLGLAAAR